MTRLAAELEEQAVALLGVLADGVFITLQITVEWAVRRNESFFILCNGVGDGFPSEALGVNLLELRSKGGVRIQLGGDLVPVVRMFVSHFHGIQGRAAGLFLEVGGAAVPELLGVEGGVKDCGSVDAALLAAYACGSGQVIRAALFQGMAGRAGNGVVRGEPHVMKQLVAQFHLGRVRGQLVRNGRDGGNGVFRAHHVAEDLQALVPDPFLHGRFFQGGERAAPVNHGVGGGGHGAGLEHMLQFGEGDGGGRFLHVVAALAVPHVAGEKAAGKGIHQSRNLGPGLVTVRTLGIHGMCGNFRRLGGRQIFRVLIGQEQRCDGGRHDDGAAQNGSGLEEGTCFAHKIRGCRNWLYGKGWMREIKIYSKVLPPFSNLR